MGHSESIVLLVHMSICPEHCHFKSTATRDSEGDKRPLGRQLLLQLITSCTLWSELINTDKSEKEIEVLIIMIIIN